MKTSISNLHATFIGSLGFVLAATLTLAQNVRRDDFRVSDEDLISTVGEN